MDAQSSQNIYAGHSHSFDTGIAEALGLNAAVVFNHIVYWLRINAAKSSNIKDGKVWMYETQNDISNFLLYVTVDEVKKAIVKLLDSGLLIKGNFNKNPFDRTNWYTTSDQSIFKKVLTKEPIGSIGNAERHDPTCQSAPSLNTHKDKHKEQQQRPAAVPSKTAKPKVWPCLEKVQIPDQDKYEITKLWEEKDVQNAVIKAADPNHPPRVCMAASIKYYCKRFASGEDPNKKNETPYEKVIRIFKNDEKYNGADCYLSQSAIAFDRGQKHGEVKFDDYFTWGKLVALCDSFQIPLPRE